MGTFSQPSKSLESANYKSDLKVGPIICDFLIFDSWGFSALTIFDQKKYKAGEGEAGEERERERNFDIKYLILAEMSKSGRLELTSRPWYLLLSLSHRFFFVAATRSSMGGVTTFWRFTYSLRPRAVYLTWCRLILYTLFYTLCISQVDFRSLVSAHVE